MCTVTYRSPGAPPWRAGAAKFADPELLAVLDARGDADLVGVLLADDPALSLAGGAGLCPLLVCVNRLKTT